MKQIRAICLAVGMVLGLSACAYAGPPQRIHRHHHNHGSEWVVPAIVGAGITYILTRPTQTQQQAPTVIVVETPPAPQYWFYCKERQAYHPYVTSCPSPWMLVVPH